MGYRLDGRDSISSMDKRFFATSHRPDWVWGPSGLLAKAYHVLFHHGIKQWWREAGHSPPSTTEVKNGVIPPLPMSSWHTAPSPFYLILQFLSCKAPAQLHESKSFLRSHQSLFYSRISQYFMKPEGLLLCSQEPTMKMRPNVVTFY
jgi:hypothetical protein